MCYYIIRTSKGVRDAAIAQQVERILGKDEVTSSNLVSSSTKSPETVRFRGFLLSFADLRILAAFLQILSMSLFVLSC